MDIDKKAKAVIGKRRSGWGWTPKRVDRLLHILKGMEEDMDKAAQMADYISDLVLAEERVAEMLEYMKAESERFKDDAKKALDSSPVDKRSVFERETHPLEEEGPDPEAGE